MPVIRFVLRLLATVALAVAVVLAVIDATRSIAASSWAFTPLAQGWQTVSPESFAAFQNIVETSAWPWIWNGIAVPLLALPAFAFFVVLALLFYSVGHRRRRKRAPGFAGT